MEKVKIMFPIEEKLEIELEKPDRIYSGVFRQDYFYLMLKMYQLTCSDENVLTIVDTNSEKYTRLKVNNVTKNAVSVSNRIFHGDARDYTDKTYLILLDDIREITFTDGY